MISLLITCRVTKVIRFDFRKNYAASSNKVTKAKTTTQDYLSERANNVYLGTILMALMKKLQEFPEL